MRVALLADVHANLPALEAVLAHARRQHVEALWCLGDLLGHGAFVEEVVQRLRAENVTGIAGNYDLKVLQVEAKRARWADGVPAKWLPFVWAYERLSPASREYLAALPLELRLEAEGKRILMVHGSPESDREALRPDTPRARLLELARLAQADLVLCGHSHIPFLARAAGVRFINPGSVGRAFDDAQRACYAVLTLRPGRVQTTQHCIEYDWARSQAMRVERGVPPEATAEAAAPASTAVDGIETVSSAAQGGEDDERLLSVHQLAEQCPDMVAHMQQVTRLALMLFDQLRAVHGLGPQERFWLQSAGLLHDIGLVESEQKHHKASLRIIRSSPMLPFDKVERLIIGSVARYHRGALPARRHAHYAQLAPSAQRSVRVLAAMLRVADGLDYSHQNSVLDLSCEVHQRRIVVRCNASRSDTADLERAQQKGDLFEVVFGRKLALDWRIV